MTINKHGNGLPEKPTAHQTGRPYDSFIIAANTQ